MSDLEARVMNMIDKRDSYEVLQDGLETLRNVEKEDRDEFTDQLTAQVAYLLMCRAKNRGDIDQSQSYAQIAREHIQRVDTSTQAKCKPPLSDHPPDLLHEGVIDMKEPVKTV